MSSIKSLQSSRYWKHRRRPPRMIDMDGRRGRSKAAVAAEAWAALLDLTMGQGSRFFRILHEFGLTPGDRAARGGGGAAPPRAPRRPAPAPARARAGTRPGAQAGPRQGIGGVGP